MLSAPLYRPRTSFASVFSTPPATHPRTDAVHTPCSATPARTPDGIPVPTTIQVVLGGTRCLLRGIRRGSRRRRRGRPRPLGNHPPLLRTARRAAPRTAAAGLPRSQDADHDLHHRPHG